MTWRVALDRHERGEPHRAELGHAAHVVPAQVHEHEVLGPLLRVGRELGGERGVSSGVRAAGPGAGDRPEGHLAVLHPHQDLRRAADDVDVVAVEVVQIRRRIERAEVAVGEERIGRGQVDPAAQHRLEGVARGDVLLDPAHVRLERSSG